VSVAPGRGQCHQKYGVRPVQGGAGNLWQARSERYCRVLHAIVSKKSMWAVYCATACTLRVFRVYVHIESASAACVHFMGFPLEGL
jgi:hypothetical protein